MIGIRGSRFGVDATRAGRKEGSPPRRHGYRQRGQGHRSTFTVRTGSSVRIAPALSAPAAPTTNLRTLDRQPVVAAAAGPRTTRSLVAKRGLDIVGATAGLIVLSPLFGAVGLAILLTDGRPILFRQPRSGHRG